MSSTEIALDLYRSAGEGADPTGTPARPGAAAGRGTGRALAAVVSVAVALRFATLAHQSYWLDEAYTVNLLHRSWADMWHALGVTESTPPAYYVLAWVWTRVWGPSEFGLRSLSALAGVGTVLLGYASARRLAGRRAGLAAAGLIALSPIMVWFSQEARAYALASAAAAAGFLCLVGYLDSGRARWLAGWAVSSGVGLATHYFVVFVVAPEIVWLLLRAGRRPGCRVAIGFVAAVGAALVPLALRQQSTGHADYIAQGALGQRVLQAPKQLLIGYASPGQQLTGGLAALLVLACLASVIRRRTRLGDRLLLPLSVGLGGVLVPVLLALLGIDFLNTRNLLPALAVLLVVPALGLAVMVPARVAAALGGLIAGVFLIVIGLVLADAHFQRPDWRGVSRALGPPAWPRVIVVAPGSGLLPLQIYQPGLAVLTAATSAPELDVVAIAPQVTGRGLGSVPRPVAPLPVPSGFRLYRAVYGTTFTVLRYRAAAAVSLAPSSVAGVSLEPGSLAVLRQGLHRPR